MKRSFSRSVSLLCVMLVGMLFVAIPPVSGQTQPGQQGQPRPGEQGQAKPDPGQPQPGGQEEVPSDPAKAREEIERLEREIRRHNPIIDIERRARREPEFREQMKQFGSPKVRALMEAIEAEMRAREALDQAEAREARASERFVADRTKENEQALVRARQGAIQASEDWTQASAKAGIARRAAEEEHFQANPQAREAYQRAIDAYNRFVDAWERMQRREAERKEREEEERQRVPAIAERKEREELDPLREIPTEILSLELRSVPPRMTATPQLHGGIESTGGGDGGGGGGSGGSD